MRIILVLLLMIPLLGYGQEAVAPRPSPVAVAAARYKDSYLKIVYCQPHKRGRLVFGDLVPYGQVWRTGANEATELTTTRDISIQGTTLKAGTYAVFTIPEKDSWTIIFNGDLGQWGAYNYNPKADILRLKAPVQLQTAPFEAFTIAIVPKNEKADITFTWDNVLVTLPVQFTEPKP